MLLAGYVALVVTSSLQALSPWHVPTPELLLLIVLYLGLVGRGTAPELVGLALGLGYLAVVFTYSRSAVLLSIALLAVGVGLSAMTNRRYLILVGLDPLNGVVLQARHGERS